MIIANLARDVVREAFARRFMLAAVGFIALGVLALALALDLEVVEGTLAAGRLFGLQLHNPIVPLDVAMRDIFAAFAYPMFYLGLLFGIVATSGTAASMLAPGRVELLLSLPVRRVELVLGLFTGVLVISLLCTLVAVGGVAAVLFAKTGFVTAAPAAGALMAILGFLPVYAAMLLATSLVRSPALAAGCGLLLLIAGVVASDRAAFVALFKPGLARSAVDVIITPLPRLHWMVTAGAEAAGRGELWNSAVTPAVASALVLAAALVAGAVFVVSGKDY
ncbi:MAG: ABC transporter permease subunit [Pseudomonadota bacterium]